MLRATVKRAIPYPSGGTALVIDLHEGTVKPGESIRLSLPARTIETTVRGVGMLDHDIGRPTFRAEITVLVKGLDPSDVPPGTAIVSTHDEGRA